MPQDNIQFQTADNVILRGWLFTPEGSASDQKLPCLVMSHGFSALKEMDLDTFAKFFISKLRVACLVYDNRVLTLSLSYEHYTTDLSLVLAPSKFELAACNNVSYTRSQADFPTGASERAMSRRASHVKRSSQQCRLVIFLTQ